MVLLRVIAMWLTSLLLSLAVPTGVSVAASPVAQSPIYTYDNTHISSVTADAAAERGPPASPDRQFTYDADDLRSHGTAARPNGAAAGSTTTYTASDEFIQVARAMGTTQTRPQGDGGALSAPSEFEVAANSVRPAVTDARLGRALADDFRGGPNPIGDGSALDAARHTVDTGELVGGSTHLEKSVEMRDRYARILRRGGLSSADQAVAQGRYDAYSSFVIENDLDVMMRARGLR